MEQTARSFLCPSADRSEGYREPLCFELAGLRLRLTVDQGGEYVFSFSTENTAAWGPAESDMPPCFYECLKLQDKLYLISLLPGQGRAGACLVADLQTGLAVLVDGIGGFFSGRLFPGSPRFPAASPLLTGHTLLWRYGATQCFTQTFGASSYSLLFTQKAGGARACRCAARCFSLWQDVALIASFEPGRREAVVMLLDLCAVRTAGLVMSTVVPNEVSPAFPYTLFSAYGTFVSPEETPETVLASAALPHYQTRLIGQKVYNPVALRPAAGGLKQYVPPLCDELAGQTLDFHPDGYPPVFIRFLTPTSLEWSLPGETAQHETYECVKGKDTVYLVVCHPRLGKPASCVTLVWDRDTRLITAVLAWEHLNTDYPRMITSRAVFGAENRPGESLPSARHGFTDDLIGRRLLWHYTAVDDVLHICFSHDHFRLGAAEVRLVDNPDEAALKNYDRLSRRKDAYPYYEENDYYIRIRENLYLYSVIEYAMCRLVSGQGGGELLALVDTARQRYIGRTFGLDAQLNAGHDIVGAPGCFLETPDPVESLPSPLYTFND